MTWICANWNINKLTIRSFWFHDSHITQVCIPSHWVMLVHTPRYTAVLSWKTHFWPFLKENGIPQQFFYLHWEKRMFYPVTLFMCMCHGVVFTHSWKNHEVESNAEENDYTFLIPFHSLHLITSKSMFSSVLDVSPHQFYIMSISSHL